MGIMSWLFAAAVYSGVDDRRALTALCMGVEETEGEEAGVLAVKVWDRVCPMKAGPPIVMCNPFDIDSLYCR